MVAEAIREEDSEAEAVWRALEDGAGACSVGPYMVRVEVHIDESGDYSYLEADTEREEEARRWFRAHGYGKHDSWLRARRQAQEDAARLEGPWRARGGRVERGGGGAGRRRGTGVRGGGGGDLRERSGARGSDVHAPGEGSVWNACLNSKGRGWPTSTTC